MFRKGLFVGCLGLLFGLSLGAQEQQVELAELDLTKMRQAWGEPQVNLSVEKKPISIGGKAFAKGLGTHASSRMVIALDGQVKRFTAEVGINDVGGERNGKVAFPY